MRRRAKARSPKAKKKIKKFRDSTAKLAKRIRENARRFIIDVNLRANSFEKRRAALKEKYSSKARIEEAVEKLKFLADRHALILSTPTRGTFPRTERALKERDAKLVELAFRDSARELLNYWALLEGENFLRAKQDLKKLGRKRAEELGINFQDYAGDALKLRHGPLFMPLYPPAKYREAIVMVERLINTLYSARYGSLAEKPTLQSMLLFIQNVALKEIEKLRKELGYE